MVHLGRAATWLDENVVDRCVTLVESTTPELAARAPRSTPPAAHAAVRRPRAARARRCAALARTRAAVRAIPGLDVLDERLRRARRACTPTTRCGWRSTCAARGRSGYELARCCASTTTCTWSSPARTWWWPCSAWARRARPQGERLVAALRRAVERAERATSATPSARVRAAAAVGRARDGRRARRSSRRRRWCRCARPPAAWPPSRWRPTRPGIPNVLPGERLTAETLDYIQQTLELGGSLRGASDRPLRTLRVRRART